MKPTVSLLTALLLAPLAALHAADLRPSPSVPVIAKGVRQIYLSISKDMQHWSEPELVMNRLFVNADVRSGRLLVEVLDAEGRTVPGFEKSACLQLRTGKTITVGFRLVVRSANGVGSRFRATTNHMENALSENDSRPLPQNATVIHLPILTGGAVRQAVKWRRESSLPQGTPLRLRFHLTDGDLYSYSFETSP